jgi:hypothetical protein
MAVATAGVRHIGGAKAEIDDRALAGGNYRGDKSQRPSHQRNTRMGRMSASPFPEWRR